jgi:small subunit ribosomal protein S17
MVTNQSSQKVVNTKPIVRKFEGVVLSDKSDKTIVVLVERTKKHPKYQKRYKVGRKFKVHDETNSYKVGDKVSFIECRPLSKEKKWRVIKNK